MTALETVVGDELLNAQSSRDPEGSGNLELWIMLLVSNGT